MWFIFALEITGLQPCPTRCPKQTPTSPSEFLRNIAQTLVSSDSKCYIEFFFKSDFESCFPLSLKNLSIFQVRVILVWTNCFSFISNSGHHSNVYLDNLIFWESFFEILCSVQALKKKKIKCCYIPTSQMIWKLISKTGPNNNLIILTLREMQPIQINPCEV